MNYELKSLAIGYGRKVVAEGLNTSLRSGELTCLIGSNGVGKSTLLRTLAGFQPMLAGSITLNDDDGSESITLSTQKLSAAEQRKLARLVSVVLTHHGELTNMTVRELVAMGRSPYTGFWGRLSPDDERIVTDAMAIVGITALAERMVTTLSDGERQKCMIAKALAQQTPVILLDEPTAFLDFNAKVTVMRELRSLAHEYGKTIFLSTHDVDIALQTADRLWLMRNEITIGTPQELAESGAIADFIAQSGATLDPHSMSLIIK